jgi:signal transduction histidine kinase
MFSNVTPIFLLYLFYGAAFLFLGVSIAAKDLKGSDLKLADNLWLLGAFGFFHGIREWLELGHLIEGGHFSPEQLIVSKTAALLLIVISFLFLLQFGISLISGLAAPPFRLAKLIPAPLLLLWTLYVWRLGDGAFQIDMALMQRAEFGARFLFGFPGGLLTAYGLISYSREVRTLCGSAAKRLCYAGSAFFFYAIFAGLFSSGYSIFRLPVPVELIRGSLAFLITYFIANALNIFDIETRKKIEQQTRRLVQAEKLASLGQLAAGIAHEINNPLANASLCVQTLKKRLVTSAAVDIIDRLDAVERNIDRASSIARELLQFSRQRESEFQPLDINGVIDGTLTLMRCKLEGFTVRKELTPVPEIMGDHGKLEQVLINLLSNSMEAMPGGGTISIATSVQGEIILLRVEDSGGGIAAADLSQVFDPFFTTKEIGHGTGLGLSICYGIVRQHGGQIDIASAPGKGTAVTVRLPVRLRV